MRRLSYTTGAHRGASLLVAVSGGIGSGKSVVSRCLRAMGYPVYDCDSEARQLMDNSEVIKTEIAAKIGEECVKGGCIDRVSLSRVVFGDNSKLDLLNVIVHGAVRSHLAQWHHNRSGIKFVETAILYQSGLDAMVDAVIEVVAPRDLRISRVMKRSGLTSGQAEARMDAQDGYVPVRPHENTYRLLNDGLTPVLPQLEAVLSSLFCEK